MASGRMVFIPELRAKIVEQLVGQGLSAELVERALLQWDEGGEARSPLEAGCFSVFRQIQSQVEKE